MLEQIIKLVQQYYVKNDFYRDEMIEILDFLEKGECSFEIYGIIEEQKLERIRDINQYICDNGDEIVFMLEQKGIYVSSLTDCFFRTKKSFENVVGSKE